MIQSTTNQSLIFLTRQPAWEKGVSLKQRMQTDVFTARGGLTQSQGRHAIGKYQISYEAVLDRAGAAGRKGRALFEIRHPLIVPFWTERGVTTSTIVGDVVTIDRAPDADWFRPGDYVYLSSALGNQFRQVGGVSFSDLTFAEDVDAINYLPGATIYPCRACLRDIAGATFDTRSEDSVTEPLTYQTL